MSYVPPELVRNLKRATGLDWSDLTRDQQRITLGNYKQAGAVSNWDAFFDKAGLIDLDAENKVLEAVAKEEINRADREKEYLAQQSDRWQQMTDAYHDWRYQQKLEQLNQIQRAYSYAIMKRDYSDPATSARLSEGGKKAYGTPFLLPMNALNKTYPIRKRVAQESGWDRFTNSVEKGWHYFSKWFCETGWKLLLSLSVEILIGCIPGIGALLGMVARTGADVLLDILDCAKTSAERAHLQRAIEEGKSRGIDSYEEMFLWRSVMITLILAVAQDNGFILQGTDLGNLFRTKDEFMSRIQNPEFLQSLWAVESQAEKDLIGEEEDGAPDFQKVPEDLAAAREMALDMLRQCLTEGNIRGIGPGDLRKWLG